MRAALFCLLAWTGCSQAPDPCASVAGLCVTVEVGGAPSPLDELDVSASQLPGPTVHGRAATPGGIFNLPVQFAAVLPDSFTGPVLISVVGVRNGQPLGFGSAALTVPPAGQRLTITMAPLDATVDLAGLQIGADLTTKPTDMAVPPGVDLSIPSGVDLAPIAPCTGNCTVGTFTTQSQRLNPPRTAYGLVVVGRNVYLIGGQAGAVTPAATTSVQRAPINPDGTLGQFAENGTPLIDARQLVSAAASSQYVYVAGGSTDNGISAVFDGTVERAPIFSDGTIGSFSKLSSQLTTPRDSHATAVIGSNLVVLGGADASGLITSVEVAPILSDGSLGTFSAGPSLITARSPTLVITSSFLYVVGGEAGGDVTIERTSISGGVLGTFSIQPISLRSRRTGHSATYVGTNVYVLGGGFGDIDAGVGGPIFPTGFERSLDSFGTLSDFGSLTNGTLQTGRGGHGAVFTGNAFYVIGGYAGGTAPIDTIERASVQ